MARMASISRRDEPTDMDEDHRCRPWGQSRFQRFGRKGQRVRGDVRKAGKCPRMHGGGRGGEEGIRRNDHFPVLDLQDPENDLEGTGPAAHCYGVGSIVATGERLLEIAGARSESEGAALERLIDHPQDLLAILRRKHDPSSRYTRSGHAVTARAGVTERAEPGRPRRPRARQTERENNDTFMSAMIRRWHRARQAGSQLSVRRAHPRAIAPRPRGGRRDSPDDQALCRMPRRRSSARG